MIRPTSLDDRARCSPARRAALIVLLSILGWTCLLAPASAPAADPGRDVRDFGAKGDGQSDDTDAIQKAVDGKGGSVVFGRGTYRITRPIVVDYDRVGFTSILGDGTARVVMAGAGPAFKLVGTHKGSASPAQFEARVWERQRMPVVEGLEIVGDHPEADGIEATGTMQLTIRRLLVREARHAIHLTTRNRNVIIADCHLYHNRGIGLFLDHVDLHQINVTGSHISYNAGGGIVSRGGAVRNLHVGTCDIESNMAADAPPTANILLDSTDGSIAEVAITGCTLQHNHTSPGSANIRILGVGIGPRNMETQEGHVTITGNVLSDVMVNIHLQDARGVTIVGNTFWSGFERDLLVEGSRNVVVGANNFDRNPRYSANKELAAAPHGLLFRDSADCSLDGLVVSGAKAEPAAVAVENCRRFNITDCTILDSDHLGLLLRDVTDSRVSDCLIRDDREGREPSPAFRLVGGGGNMVVDNAFAHGAEIGEGNHVEGNMNTR